jgi:hypothetical protein
MQVNVFMPSMQISFLPWIYDEQVVEHARYLQYFKHLSALKRQSGQKEPGKFLSSPGPFTKHAVKLWSTRYKAIGLAMIQSDQDNRADREY